MRSKSLIGRLTVFTSVLVSAFLTHPDFAKAFDIEEVHWGFSGKIFPQEINPLFLRLRNNTGEAEEFTLNLKQRTYGSRSVGATISVAEEGNTIFLAPYTERWVTFYLYASHSSSEVQLFKEDKRVGDPIPMPNQSRSATEESIHRSRVLFTASDEFNLNRNSQLKRFPSEVFPPNLTGTDTLEVVFLDHVPRWQPEQRKTFLRWLNRGGILHLLQTRTGTYPTFDEELAVLNGPLDHQYIGGGLVIRHPFSQHNLDKKMLEDIVKQEFDFFQTGATPVNQENYGYHYYGDSLEHYLFPTLKEYVNPNHNWPVMYLISFLYLLLIFPGAWLVMKKWSDFRITYGSLLLGMLLFALIFNVVGARGYGESTQINSIALAQVLPDDELDVMQYSNAFVTSGGFFELQHQGSGLIYSTGSDSEEVLGKIQLGTQAEFSVDIPPFSSRPFIHRTLINKKAPTVELTTFDPEKGLSSLELNIDSLDAGSQLWAIHKDRISPISLQGSSWSTKRSGQPLSEFLQSDEYFNDYDIYGQQINHSANKEKIDSQLFRKVMHKSFRFQNIYNNGNNNVSNSIKQDRVYLFIQSEMPEELKCASESFQKQSGNIIYQYELILSE
ncbi:MAG: hypothetical protein KDA65_02060 [Planctomycetaceae bacterium]|nr:hypothetical protein [Planctomycetaceae bacterium]